MTRNNIVHALVVMLITLAAAAFVIDWNVVIGPGARRYTDDARLEGDPTRLAAHVGGYLIAVPVRDFEAVHAGDLLFAIEDMDYRARVDRASADVGAGEAAVAEAEANLALQEARLGGIAANIRGAEAELDRASQERARQSKLLDTESFLQRNWQNAVAGGERQRATVAGDRKSRAAAAAELDVLNADLEGRRAALEARRAALALAQTDEGYTRIVAPFDGIVTARLARLGEYVAPGRALITLVAQQHFWVVANYREVQLARVRPGQPAAVSIDALPGLVLHGHVDSIEPITEAEQSPLPPDRAVGTFTKIIQRVPVKIALDERPDLGGRLRPGLSAGVSINTAGREDFALVRPPNE